MPRRLSSRKLRDPELARRARGLLVAYEGLHTYGGMSGRDMEALACGIHEMVDGDDHVAARQEAEVAKVYHQSTQVLSVVVLSAAAVLSNRDAGQRRCNKEATRRNGSRRATSAHKSARRAWSVARRLSPNRHRELNALSPICEFGLDSLSRPSRIADREAGSQFV